MTGDAFNPYVDMDPSQKGALRSVWWILAAVLIVEIVVRFVFNFRLDRVLLAETITFVVAAAALMSVVRRVDGLSQRSSMTIVVVALAFVLGAIRSGLWFAGFAVQWANVIILVAALSLFTVWWRRRKNVD